MRKGRPPADRAVLEREIQRALSNLSLPPLVLAAHLSGTNSDRGHDGVLDVTWQGHRTSFAFQIKTRWTREALQKIAVHAKSTPPDPSGLRPLVVVPYLSERHVEDLLDLGISGLDVCGNALLVDPPKLFVLRTGAKSLLRATDPRPSVYQSNNIGSLVPRVLLREPTFQRVGAVLEACHARMQRLGSEAPRLSLPTISKALSQLEQDLVITRKGHRVDLSDPSRLLENLARGFREPIKTDSFLGKTSLRPDELWTTLRALRPEVRVTVTGRGSAGHHAGLAGPERLQLYVSDVQRTRDVLAARPTAAFPNLELIETPEESPFFDPHEENGVPWSSRLQCYLELSQGDPRERTVAEHVRTRILQGSRTERS